MHICILSPLGDRSPTQRGSHELLGRVASDRSIISERQISDTVRRHELYNFVAEADG